MLEPVCFQQLNDFKDVVPPRVQKTLQLEGFLIVLTDLKYGGHLRIFI